MIETLVAVAISTIVALALSAVLIDIGWVSRTANDQAEKANLADHWNRLASSEATCTNSIILGTSLNPPTALSASATEIAFDFHDGPTGGSTILQQNLTLPKYGLMVQPAGFHFVIPAGTSRVPYGANFLWTGYIELAVQKISSAASATQTYKPAVLGPLMIKVDSSNNVLGCSKDFASDPSAECILLDGSWSGSACTVKFSSTCPNGSVQIGPAPTDCISCGANKMLVSNGSGFTCQPYLGLTVTPGGCGSSDGQAVSTAPASSLCWTGIPTAVTGSGPWSWTCNGINGGTNVSCSAPLLTCSGGATTTPSANPASPMGCFCPGALTWNGTTCAVAVASSCYAYNWVSSICGSAGTCIGAGGSCSPFPDLVSCNSGRSTFIAASSGLPGYTPVVTNGAGPCYTMPCFVVTQCGVGSASCTGGASTNISAYLATPGCYCPSGGWNGTSCNPTPPICTGGAASGTVTPNPASPSGCYCPFGKTWNGAACT